MRFRAKQAWSVAAGILILAGVSVARSQEAAGASSESQVALTPPMGWNSWNHFHCGVTEDIVKAQAYAMATNGMKAAGYIYVNIDDCWQGGRDAEGNIQPNSKFPDMKGLADYIHSLGLKFGVYSSPGPKTCAGYTGSYQHELQDAKTYASWGVDYLKYDWCSAREVYQPDQMQAVYRKMSDALKSTGRPIVFSLCQYGLEQVWRWGASVGGNSWRTTGDINASWTRMAYIGFGQNGLESFAGPGHWNDPDMLEIGNTMSVPGRNGTRRAMGLNPDEDRTQMSLWSMLASPLLAGNDLTSMDSEVLSILTNKEVIAVDQDPKGVQGHRVWQQGPLEIWMKPLADGGVAVALFNRGTGPANMTVNFSDIGITGSAGVRDLWLHKDMGTFTGSYSASVPRHGVVMIRVKAGS
ncbi:MAG TPA: glycoside hydrolase family 27 protein [Terriglobia bacterium]|nr:glycoside hydrolase family 27 protein [Terriglobia bacterium]